MDTSYDGRELVALARESLEDHFLGRSRQLPDKGGMHGAFVTLEEDGALRGCIGYMQGVESLYRQVYTLAREAAFSDWRFPPLGEDELAKVTVKVSVLSSMETIGSLDDFVLGRDGILMTICGRRAVFLPEVALETGWSKEEELAALSRKAGLPPDAWKSPDALFQTFTSEVFSEV